MKPISNRLFGRIKYATLIIILLVTIFPSCKKFLGLSLQTNATHTSYLLDPNLNMTAWQYMKYRSGYDTTNPSWRTDTVFRLMYKAVIYSGIDTSEYTKPNRTYIFLHNLAVQTFNATIPITVSNNCYWGYYLVGTPDTAASSWSQYTPAQVKAWLQYLIVTSGEYNFNNLTPNGTTVTTLLPPNTDTLNPQSIMVLARNDDQNAALTINNFVGSANYTTVRSSGYVATNGPIQVVGALVVFKRAQ